MDQDTINQNFLQDLIKNGGVCTFRRPCYGCPINEKLNKTGGTCRPPAACTLAKQILDEKDRVREEDEILRKCESLILSLGACNLDENKGCNIDSRPVECPVSHAVPVGGYCRAGTAFEVALKVKEKILKVRLHRGTHSPLSRCSICKQLYADGCMC